MAIFSDSRQPTQPPPARAGMRYVPSLSPHASMALSQHGHRLLPSFSFTLPVLVRGGGFAAMPRRTSCGEERVTVQGPVGNAGNAGRPPQHRPQPQPQPQPQQTNPMAHQATMPRRTSCGEERVTVQGPVGTAMQDDPPQHQPQPQQTNYWGPPRPKEAWAIARVHKGRSASLCLTGPWTVARSSLVRVRRVRRVRCLPGRGAVRVASF